MKRILFVLILTVVVASIAPTLATSAPSGRPFLEMGVCNHASDNTFYVNADWGNQTPGPGDLNVTITFKGAMVGTQTYVTTIAGPIAAEDLVNAIFVPQFSGPNGPIAWDAWSSVTISSTGAFTDESKALKEPHGGWGICTF